MTAERDPITAYLETFERLRARKRWTTDTATYRFVALTLGAAGAPDLARPAGGGRGRTAAARRLDEPAALGDPLRGGRDYPDHRLMPVFEFRGIEEMKRRAWRRPGDPSLYRAMRLVLDDGRRAPAHHFLPGLHIIAPSKR